VPELPDVEGHRRTIDEHAAGLTVRAVRVADSELLQGTSPAGLSRSLRGRVVAASERRGKWLWLRTDDGTGPTLVFHFRQTGELVFDDQDEDVPGDVLTLVFDTGRLTYRTQRRLGGVSYLRPGTHVEDVTGPLGPDAAEIDRSELEEALAGHAGAVKSALLNQRRVAGLGNELVDEILWRSGIHPRRAAGELDREAVREMHRELRSVLGQAIRAGHVPSGPTWLNGQRTAPSPTCPRCGTQLERGKVAGRTTFWCPRDQTEDT
jgi:formamidopyrimidine-DNA glycosylase